MAIPSVADLVKAIIARDAELAALPFVYEENKRTKPPATGTWLTLEVSPSTSDTVTFGGARPGRRETFACELFILVPAGTGADVPKRLAEKVSDLFFHAVESGAHFSEVGFPAPDEDITGQWFYVSVSLGGTRDR